MLESTKSLRSYWRLGEVAGATDAIDTDPVSPRNGTYQGNPVLGAAGIPGNAAEPNTAVTFGGTDDFVLVPYIDTANGALTNPAGTFTLEAWVKPEAPGVVLSSYSVGLGRGFVLEVVPGAAAGSFQARARVGTGAGVFATAVGDLTPGTAFDGWWYVVVTYENPGAAGVVKLYVNAGAPTQVAGANYTDVRPAQAPPLRIGAGWNEPQETQPGQFFKGGIDEVAVYDKALSQNEIKTHFDFGKQP